MKKPKIPKSFKGRIKDAAKAHDFASPDAFFNHIMERGLKQYEFLDGSAPMMKQLEQVMDQQGYSSIDEVVEHLVERGLTAYENRDGLDREKFEARLRGLGYID